MPKDEIDRSRQAVVLIAHGSRNADANADAFYFADQLRKLGVAGHIEAAFLELAKPTIAAAVSSCLATGSKTIVLLPYFLSAGVHVRRDLREMCQQFGQADPEVQFVLAEPLGRHALIADVLKERLSQALMQED